MFSPIYGDGDTNNRNPAATPFAPASSCSSMDDWDGAAATVPGPLCGRGLRRHPARGGGACFEPNMVSAHAAYAMNQLYEAGAPVGCDFRSATSPPPTR
ncbi:hypothetical protein ZWY2020_017311 [Hordeum vulgare]|nr:hypothetical protein ZWY2020_017311 [Hordeum vulgare]